MQFKPATSQDVTLFYVNLYRVHVESARALVALGVRALHVEAPLSIRPALERALKYALRDCSPPITLEWRVHRRVRVTEILE